MPVNNNNNRRRRSQPVTFNTENIEINTNNRSASIYSNHSVFINQIEMSRSSNGSNNYRRFLSNSIIKDDIEEDNAVLPEPSMSLKKFHATIEQYTSL